MQDLWQAHCEVSPIIMLMGTKFVLLVQSLEYMRVKYGLLVFRCLNCSKYYENEFGKDLSKKTAKTYIFCDGKIDKFCLMLRKDI